MIERTRGSRREKRKRRKEEDEEDEEDKTMSEEAGKGKTVSCKTRHNEHPTLPPLADCEEPIVAKANNACSHNR